MYMYVCRRASIAFGVSDTEIVLSALTELVVWFDYGVTNSHWLSLL